MLNTDVLQWMANEFAPVELATPTGTILQLKDNAVRYFNTHSGYPIVKMFDATTSTVALQLTPDYKNVVQVYPATTPDWVLQNYPLWSLLGITIIDNLTSDLVMLSEAYRNYKYYMGTDFKFHFERNNDPMVGGQLFLSNLPSPTSRICVVGTKRVVCGTPTVAISGVSGTIPFVPIDSETLVLSNGTHTFTDEDGSGDLTSSIAGYTGTINLTTGAWTVSGWSGGTTTGTATFDYEEDIKSEFILNWILNYSKALVKMAEGNTLRKAAAINITTDGQALYTEGKEEKQALEEQLSREGLWLSFPKRI